jgi:hypothetical protein
VNLVDPFGLIWETIERDYHAKHNWIQFLILRLASLIGKGDGPSVAAADPEELVGTKVDIIQEWRRDPDNPSRDNEYPIGTMRKTTQTEVIIDLRLGNEPMLLPENHGRYLYEWQPYVHKRTYDDYPGSEIIFRPYIWRYDLC